MMNFIRSGKKKKNFRLQLDELKLVAWGLANALLRLHELSYTHGDLNPTNVLITLDDRGLLSGAFLSNFGSARSLRYAEIDNPLPRAEDYQAPEIFDNNLHPTKMKKYNEKIDSWSLGAVLFFVAYQQSVFEYSKNNRSQVMEGKASVKFPAFYPKEFKDLLSKCFLPNPAERISMAEILKHPFMSYVHVKEEKDKKKNYTAQPNREGEKSFQRCIGNYKVISGPVIMRSKKITSSTMSDILREIDVRVKFRACRFLEQLLDYYSIKNECYFICSDYSLTLREYVKTKSLLDLTIITDLFIQITLGLDYLHKQSAIHRDVCPDNILLCLHEDNVKLTQLGNFSFTKIAIKEEVSYPKNIELSYVPIEAQLQGLSKKEIVAITSKEDFTTTITNKIDIWGLGMTLYFMLYKEEVSSFNENNLQNLISHGVFFPKVRKETNSLIHLHEIVTSCLQILSQNRPSARAILMHLSQ